MAPKGSRKLGFEHRYEFGCTALTLLNSLSHKGNLTEAHTHSEMFNQAEDKEERED